MDKQKDKVYWLINSKENESYPTSTWVRCMKIEEFVKRVEKESEIIGILFKGNNLGFVLKKNYKEV